MGRSPRSRARRGAAALYAASFVLLAASQARVPPPEPQEASARTSSCLACHEGIEDMHPEARLSCVDCHGGDDTTTNKLAAHVQPAKSSEAAERDERVAPRETDLAYRRFRNPMDLRVAATTCGTCHEQDVQHLLTSLHGTTAGHLSDGFYEAGLVEKKGSRYGIFAVPPSAARPGDITQLESIPAFDDRRPRDTLAGHYADLARKECMQCHLWSEGRAVRGRVGFDGDYRGEGCAACHVEYARDGLSESADQAVSKTEPGHPRMHTMTAIPTTDACTACHYGDASIGLHFRGLSQLPPGAPGGPDIPGTTGALLNRQFYLQDLELGPPDVHHERGMHCIDCHTQNDVMGDGQLYGAMEHAVEISCSDCHGTFTEPAKLVTQRGTRLPHLRWEGERVVLRSKVDGSEHPVPQAVHVLDPERTEYNPRAVEAMTAEHANVECYTCHNAWNVNFLGFHFDRNESLTQLDLLSGRRTPGRVTTQEKVFATWKSFYAGLNEAGRVAPYLTGFATMGTARDAQGQVLVDQEMPVTAAGLSGMAMVHHQMHTNRPTARACVECHRSSATWGLGSANFRLGRQLAFVADRRGIEVIALDRAQLSASTPLAKLGLPDVVDLEILHDPLQGHAQYLFAAEGGRGIHVIDVRAPTAPKRVAFVPSVQPRGMALAGDWLFCADGVGGIKVYDVSAPEKISLLGQLPTFDAQEVVVQWPYAYVADGPGGLCIVDVRAPIVPRVVGGLRVAEEGAQDAVVDLDVLFQYSRPLELHGRPADDRTEARNLCAVLDAQAGMVLVDVTEPSQPRRLYPRRDARTSARQREEAVFRGIALKSHVDLAEPQGGTKTREGDFAYVLVEVPLRDQYRSSVLVIDVSNPLEPRRKGAVEAGYATEMLTPAAFYNTPFLQSVLFSPGEQGVFATDVTISAEPRQLGALASLRSAYVIAVEEFGLDEMRDESGRPLKDVSHRGSRWLYVAEIERVLGVPGERLGTLAPGGAAPEIPGQTPRLHLAQLDRDRSGFLEGAEYERGGGKNVDENGDGRIGLSELAQIAGLREDRGRTRAQDEMEGSPFLATRVDQDGDLSRLLDGLAPWPFDEDHDDRLDRGEMARAFFAALDLDGDGGLTPAELSRHPGELRQLRYGGEQARRRFEALDPNKDGQLKPRELRLEDRDWESLDRDRDGYVQLPVKQSKWWMQRGFLGPDSEWPTRQREYTHLPPVIEAERVKAVFDHDADGRITIREMKARPDLFYELDEDGDEIVTMEEIQRRTDLVGRQGVEVTADLFLKRWDLDGDGKVGPEELPSAARISANRR
jgi:Ca2+-binding EF-hand superfamily protein